MSTVSDTFYTLFNTWDSILSLQCEVMVNRLTTSNNIYDKQNSCLTGELGQQLLTPYFT